jgi:hypothetical protein
MHRLALLLAVLTLFGCATHAPRQTRFMQSVAGIELPARELQIRIYDFSDRFANVVETAADSIVAASSDPEIRRRAMHWKFFAVPAVHRAVFQFDPLAATVDAWVLCVQMREYFETGAGHARFGRQQAIAVTACRLLEEDIIELGRSIRQGGDLTIGEDFVYPWAAANPITTPSLVRRSCTGALSTFTSLDATGGFAAAGAMNEQMRDLSDRITLYAHNAPRIMQWQAEMAMEVLPYLLGAEREAAMAVLATQSEVLSTAMMDFARAERVAAFTDLEGERELIMQQLVAERILLQELVASERELLLANLRSERRAAMADIDSLSAARLEQVTRFSRSIGPESIDYFLGRALRLMALPAILVFAMGIYALMLLRRR